LNSKDLTNIALLAAVMSVLGLMPPIALSFTPVPITLQTLGVLLSGGLLGAKRGALSQLLFLLIVAVGVPVLSGGRGGIGVFIGPSAGFLISWPITALCIGYLLSLFKSVRLGQVLLVNLTVGIFLVYLIGIPVQAFVMKISLLQATKVSLAFIPGDAIKAIIASYLVYRLNKHPFFSALKVRNTRTSKKEII
jgi:biotin transport system substrate-specific component